MHAPCRSGCWRSMTWRGSPCRSGRRMQTRWAGRMSGSMCMGTMAPRTLWLATPPAHDTAQGGRHPALHHSCASLHAGSRKRQCNKALQGSVIGATPANGDSTVHPCSADALQRQRRKVDTIVVTHQTSLHTSLNNSMEPNTKRAKQPCLTVAGAACWAAATRAGVPPRSPSAAGACRSPAAPRAAAACPGTAAAAACRRRAAAAAGRTSDPGSTAPAAAAPLRSSAAQYNAHMPHQPPA